VRARREERGNGGTAPAVSKQVVACRRCWAPLPGHINYCPECGLRTGADSRLRRGLVTVLVLAVILCMALGALLDNLLAGLGALLGSWL
jgi:hypothetical protein